MSRPARQPFDEAVLAKRHGFRRGVVGEHGDGDFGVSGGCGGAWRDGGAERVERLRRPFAPVPDDELMAGFEEIMRHRRAHGAEAEECDFHEFSPVSSGNFKPCLRPPPARGAPHKL